MISRGQRNLRYLWLISICCLGGVLTALVWISLRVSASPLTSVTGKIFLLSGEPAVGAWVRVQTTDNSVYTEQDGSFTIANITEGETITLTAWQSGHKVGWTQATPPTESITITLNPYPTGDNPDYEWNTSYPDPDSALGCGHCMLPAYDEWQHSAHAAAGTNPRFFSLYNGTDISGSVSIAPGFKMDFPGTAGNCATCHAPGAAYDAPFNTDMNTLTGVEQEGVFCEFCHKVGDVYLDPASDLPYNNAPGVLAMRLYRPFPGDQLFFGSLDDVTRRVSYLPLEKQSRFCAPCHQFAFWGTPIYESYREWLESSYPQEGIECQTCHMPTGENPTFVPPDLGGLARNPERLASHRDLGIKDLTFMQESVAMTLTAEPQGNTIVISTTLQNIGAGHHLPTDHPGRHLILTISVFDMLGNPLQQVSGPQVPNWGGDKAGAAGQIYAKILQDSLTGDYPVVSYWKQTRILSDNRIPALQSTSQTFGFTAPAHGQIKITTELVFRRSFQAEMETRDWNDPDIILASETILLDIHTIYIPLIAH